MKIDLAPSNKGSVLVIALVVSVILLITLTGYLTLVSDENRAVGRAQAWNAAMPMAEAGVEEALTQLQYAGTNNLSTNGWTVRSDGMYHKTRSLRASGSYSVAIQPVSPPVIWSTGYVAAADSSAQISRLIKVTAVPAPSFGNGITAKGSIQISSGTLASYTVTNGVYDTVPGASFVALTDTNFPGAINLSSGDIYGYADTGPGPTNSISTSGSGAVGDSNYIATVAKGVEAGHYNDNANFQFNDVSAPSFSTYYTSFTMLGNTNIAGVPGQTTYYEVSTISSSDNTKPLIIYGNVTIYVTSTSGNQAVNISGSGFIDITTNSSLTLYTAGGLTVSGGGLVNGTGLAKNLTVYGLPTCTSITYSGSANFVGVVDAPEANFTFSGGENAIGAFVLNSVNVSGGSGVYYDTSLGAGDRFVVNNWNEMSVSH